MRKLVRYHDDSSYTFSDGSTFDFRRLKDTRTPTLKYTPNGMHANDGCESPTCKIELFSTEYPDSSKVFEAATDTEIKKLFDEDKCLGF